MPCPSYRWPRSLRHAVLFLWLALGVTVSASGQRSALVDQRLDAPPFDRYLWGVVLTDADGNTLYDRNAGRLFMPASNAKLIVAATAAALLPPDWTVMTSLYATGPVANGIVQGDLILYGRGDPTFSKRCYGVDTTALGACQRDPLAQVRFLASQLRERGIRQIAGNIIGDGSYFETTIVHPAWVHYDLNWWFAAPVSGLGLNDNAIDITYRPGVTVGAPPTISFIPDFGNIAFANRSRTSEPRTRRTIDFFRTPGSLAIWAEGNLPMGTRERTEYFALPDPNQFAAEALRFALAEEGISVRGSTTSTTDSLRFHTARQSPALAEVESRPLSDWIFPILNTSQNLFAEMLLKQLGKQFADEGSWKAGIRVERRFLIDSVRIDSTEISLTDGSGLAASNLITPRAFAALLAYMWRHPRYATFAPGLPQSGNRGSLSARFIGSPLEGRVRAKTGSISKVNSLTGYIDTNEGPLIFSIIANHHTQGYTNMINYIDSIVVDLGRGP